jgi:UPF0271 protein
MEINCDMGEAYGIYELGQDAALMPLITLANVACGFHAGDPVVMRQTVRSAAANGVGVGAHPSYPDRQGFGRREMEMDRDELTAMLIYQVGALKGFLDAEGVPLTHIKPHGALYGRAVRDEQVAHAIADAAERFGVPVMGVAGTLHEKVYRAHGLQFISEYYADLDYDEDGMIVITRKHVAYDPAEATERLLRVVREGVATSRAGTEFPMRADAVCVHSDTPGVVELTRAIAAALRAEGALGDGTPKTREEGARHGAS